MDDAEIIDVGSNQIVPVPKNGEQSIVSPEQVKQIATQSPGALFTIAMSIAKSGYFPDIRDVAQAHVKIAYGAEIGMGAVSSAMGVHIIGGKPAYSANTMAAAIRRSPRHDYRIRKWTDDICEIEFFRDKESLGMAWFSIEDAKRAGLNTKTVWRQYPRAMLFSRAISMGFRAHTPDLTGGAPTYTFEELGVDIDGETGAPLYVQDLMVDPIRDQPRRPAKRLSLGSQADTEGDEELPSLIDDNPEQNTITPATAATTE